MAKAAWTAVSGLLFTRGAPGGEGAGPNLHLVSISARQRHTNRERHVIFMNLCVYVSECTSVRGGAPLAP